MKSCYLVPVIFCLTLLATLALRAQCPISVYAGEDVYLCAPPTPTQLSGNISGDYLNFFWSPTAGMNGANTLTPTVNVSTTTNYVLTGRAADMSNNLILNGDFESGNTGFDSDYIYSPGNLWSEGTYDVIPNPQASHSNFAPCQDHTSGGGNMLVVNGAGVANQNVWCQTVAVNPNTQYVFSAWLTSVIAASPAMLQFSINGAPLGGIFSPPGGTCNWGNFFQTWNSGANGIATICIVNMNTALSGNDFALDDIVFAPVCLETDTVTVHVVNITAVAAPTLLFIPCEGANVTLSGAGSSSGPDITYSWSTPNGNIVSGENTLNPVVNAAGTYTLSVIYNNGFVTCTKTATVNVAPSANQLSAWITPPAPIGCGSNNVTLIGNTNQPAFATYEWTTFNGNIVSGENSKNAVVNQPGTYTLLVTNTSNGCTATAEVTVTTATNPPIANANAVGTITCLVNTANLSGAGSSSGNNITYAWTTPDGIIVSGQNSLNAVAGAGGTYILAVTNTSNNCTSYDTVAVADDVVPPNLNIQPPGLFNCVTPALTLSATVSPTGAAISWVASNGGNIVSGQNTLNPVVNAAGTYTLTATNPANGCSSGASVTVGADLTLPFAAVLPADTLTCQQPSLVLSGSGSSVGPNFSYNWTATNGGNVVSGQNTLSPLINAAGTYTLLVTNTVNGCTALASLSVEADTNIVVAIANAPDTLTCVVNNVTLNANGSTGGASITYQWTTTDGNITGGANTPNPTANAPGTYQLLLTNTANGCSATDVAIVAQNVTTTQLQIATPGLLTCANPTLVLQGQVVNPPGNYTFQWTAASGGNVVSGGTTLNPTINAPGEYTLTSTNTANGCTASTTVQVAIEAGTPIAIAASPGPLTCALPTQTLTSNGSSQGANFAYQWTTQNGNITNGANTPSPTVNQVGDYVLVITNTANGCTATDTVAVLENKTPPLAEAGQDGTLTCYAPIYVLTANGGQPNPDLHFSWSTVDGNIIGNQDTLLAECDKAGSYVLQVTDLLTGCIAFDTVKVAAEQQQPSLSIAQPSMLNCSQTSVVIQASATGFVLIFDWQTLDGQFVGGQSSATPTVNAPGTYTLVVVDSVNGCSNTASIVVAQDIATPDIQVGQPGSITCATPSQTVQAQNLSLPGNFDYAWTASSSGNIVSGNNTLSPLVNAGGDYALLATNLDNDCTSVVSLSIAQDTLAPTADAGANDTLSCSVSNLSLDGTATGAGLLALLWTASNGGNILSGPTTLQPLVNAAGTYTLLVTNTVNGCTATDAVQVFNDLNAPQADAGPSPTLTCAIQQTALNATASTGPDFTYQWVATGGGNIVGGANTLTPTVNAPGTYLLTVTNLANGCTTTTQVKVHENVTPPPVGIAPPGILTCATTSLNLNGMPTAGNYAWLWTTGNGNIVAGANTASPTINQSGAYTLFVTDLANGCSATSVTIVGQDLALPVISVATPDTLTCAVASIALSGSVAQPTSGFSVEWASLEGHPVFAPNTLNPMVNTPGEYLFSVKNNQNGCETSMLLTVVQDTAHPVAQASASNEITCASPSVSLNGGGSSVGPHFTYLWSGGQIVSGHNTLSPIVAAAGPYVLTVTDESNGCISVAVTVVASNTAAPNVAILPPGLLTCVTIETTLSANLTGALPAFSAQWTTDNGHLVSGQATLSPLVNQPGTYLLTVTNLENGCATTTQTVVSQDIAPPGANAGPESVLHCQQPTVALQGSSPSAGNMMFAWTTNNGNITAGAATANPFVNAPGIYSLLVTNPSNGCTSADEVAVVEVPLPTFAPELLQPDCHNTKGAVDFGSVAGGKAPFSYSNDGGQTFSAYSYLANLSPGLYDLVVRDAYGCTAESSVQIDLPFEPTVALPPHIQVELGEVVQLEPVLNQSVSNIVSWEWSPAEGLSCADCPFPMAKPLRTIVYTLKIVDLNGCDAAAKVMLRVDRRRFVYAPNIFSPNGDGENETFTIYGKNVKEIRSLQIYDRWGAEIFQVKNLQANDETRGWDGTFRGKELNPAVFVWQAVIEFEDGEVEVYAGDVTLLR
ncbi:MAG: gliding motility-associated C-terminal domain-containing protein [Saprospiraceae bacterium]|nr:gliding motility-associated C-terminal domain-containing protein [Saprospiraceae bacterium]